MANKTVKTDVWERQQGESSQAYEAFAAYRDLGAERSTAKVGLLLGKTKTLMDRWSSRWNWVERAREWDNDLTKKARQEAQKKVTEMTDRHIRIAMQLQKKALEELEKLNVGELQPKEILAFLKEATTLERFNRLEAANGPTEQESQQNGPRTLADAITAAYAKRREASAND